MSKEHIEIFNNSLNEFLDIFSQNYNLENDELKKQYIYVHSKKLTGYMLFVQDMYEKKMIDTNEKFTKNSKIISQMWKTIDKNLKKEYNDKALMQNSSSKAKQVIKKVEPVEIKEPEIIYNDNLDDTSLQEFQYENKTYLKDIYDNIIQINEDNEGTYVGCIKDNEVLFFA